MDDRFGVTSRRPGNYKGGEKVEKGRKGVAYRTIGLSGALVQEIRDVGKAGLLTLKKSLVRGWVGHKNGVRGRRRVGGITAWGRFDDSVSGKGRKKSKRP